MRALWMLVATLLLASGCARHAVIDHQPGTDFSRYQSWAWAHEDENRVRGLDAARIEHALEEALSAKGLEHLDRDQADLLVRYRVDHRLRLETRGCGYGAGFHGPYYHRRYGMYGAFHAPPDFYQIDEARLIVELAERETRQVVWQAVGQRTLTEYMRPARREELIRRQVQEMFEHYPPGPPGR